MDFATYAKIHRDAVTLAPDFERADEQIFAASLNSFRDLTRSYDGARNSNGTLLRIEAGFLEKMTPNAFADFHDGVHFIGMHQALMATIADLCLYLFTQSALFPTIGNAAGEDSPRYDGNDVPGLYLLRMTIGGGVVDLTVDHARVPKDAERHIAAIYMAILMSRFVWFHELAHCTNGHVLFLQHRQIATSVNEVAEPLDLVGFKSETTRADKNGVLRHMLELDADASALLHLIRVQLDGRENIPGLLAYDDATRFDMALLAAFLMTWLFEEYQRFMDSEHGLTHPDPAIRLGHLSQNIVAHLPELHQAVARVSGMIECLSDQLPGLNRMTDALPYLSPSIQTL
jgi:hypothetical protein